MLTVSFIRENRDLVINRLKIKNFHDSQIMDQVIRTDNERRTIQAGTDKKQAELKNYSKEIGILIKSGKQKEAETIKTRMAGLKKEIHALQKKHDDIVTILYDLLIQIPNLPHESVPAGKGEMDNILIRSGGKIPEQTKDAVPHWELIKKYDIIDFDLGIKLTGAGFPVYKGKGAILQRALISFFLDENIRAGYKEFLPPLMVNEYSAFGTGQLPDKEGQMYTVPSDSFYLIPTAEVPVTNLFRDTILAASDLPLKCTSYTPCFRREAGSWGKDVRGLNRLHQFDKVEIVQIQHPDKSYETLEEMAVHIENLIHKLGLPYRIMKLCGGDISFTSAMTYDFEVYASGQQKWLEVSSVSNFESYQANRLKLRFKDKENEKPRLAHTLNGSALALPRIVAALIENNQTPHGIKIPEVLLPYAGFEMID
ncbi:MAG: seryl-tRNA synthetase [Bacteroides sp. SM23_62_1]|nr:MAG: seryl-tRNA synthetase [Bacteroides sp. SM23_62_1]